MSTKHGRHGQGATLWKSLTICRVSRLASRTTFPLSLVLRDGILRYYQAFWMTDHQSHDDNVISQTVLALDLEGVHDLKLHHPSSSVATSNQ